MDKLCHLALMASHDKLGKYTFSTFSSFSTSIKPIKLKGLTREYSSQGIKIFLVKFYIRSSLGTQDTDASLQYQPGPFQMIDGTFYVYLR